MQTHFEMELEKLKNRIVTMGNLAIQQVSVAMHILLRGETEELGTAAETEHILDKLDVKIDKICQRIFALQQPVASDLRFIMTSLRIGNELERIGDIALSIVHRSQMVREQPEILEKFNVEQIISKAYYLIQESFSNYTGYDVDKIKEVITQSHDLNEKCQEILDSVIVEMTRKSEVIVVATNLILILRQVERLADHASNIAESIYFMNEGTIIKHGNIRGKKILVLCTGNSCRSQMAEGFLKSFNNNIEVFSAGTEPAGSVNPYAIKVMQESGIDISRNYPKHVNEFIDQDFDYIITVCDHAKETCPVFTGHAKKRIHIGFEDPSETKGSESEILDAFRKVRDQIRGEFMKFNETL